MTDSLFELPTKTPYTVPSMAEVRARDNGLTAVSTFSGCGGSSTGLHMAGWHIPYASEFITPARETYEANWPDAYVDPRDIRDVDPAEILDRIGLRRGELDLFEGSPPCSSFAIMNTRSKTSGFGNMKVKNYSEGVKQATDDLFDEWLRVAEGLLPRALIAENVPDLLGPGSHHFYQSILKRIEAMGYRVTGDIYKASHFGAATHRKRLIITAARRDVLPSVPQGPRGQSERYTAADSLATQPTPLKADELEWFNCEGYAVGDYWRKMKPGERAKPIGGFDTCQRITLDQHFPGITAGGSHRGSPGPMHPTECRQFTPTEIAWFFGYPADYQWPGNPGQRYERLARSVAPPLYRAHGEVLAQALGGRPV